MDVVSLLDGIVMGGGVGLSVHSQYIVVTEKVRFAMPETGIGFFCDVGGSYFLSRLGSLGLYVALTGYQLNTADMLYSGIATHYCPSDRLNEIEKQLLASAPQGRTGIDQVLSAMKGLSPANQTSALQENRKAIDHCFSADSVLGIMERLEDLNTDWSKKCLTTLLAKSPTSLVVRPLCPYDT